jgi:thiamine pyrophosphokinase
MTPIVRPILVFTGGDAPATERIAPFFAKSKRPRIFAADSGLIAAEAYCKAFAWPTGASAVSGAAGSIEGILGDFDSLDESRLAPYPTRLIERHRRDKDESDTELALGAAHSARQASGGDAATAPIILIGGAGGRIDHLCAIERLFSGPRAPDLWLTPEQAVYCIGAGHSATLTLPNLTTADCVSVFPVFSAEPSRLHSENLFWPLDNLDWNVGAYSLSNRPAHDGPVTVSAQSGRFLVFSPLIPSS